MRLATIKVNGTEKAGIVLNRGILPIKALNCRKGNCMGGRHDEPDPETADPGLNKMV